MGRKTKYSETYDQYLIEHLSDGYSYTSFAARVNVNVDTLYEWEKRYESFKNAKEVGLTKSQSFWEDIGRKMALQGNYQAWKFNMKNRFGWRDSEVSKVNSSGEIKISYRMDTPIEDNRITLDEQDSSL